jgi:hypothetical protein
MNAIASEAVPTRDPRFIYRHRVAVGVDLGQSKDPTSIAVIEQIKAVIPNNAAYNDSPDQMAEMRRLLPKPDYKLRLLEQAPLGEPYPAQAQRLKRILARQQIAEHEPAVWMDYTGVGRAVFDIFRDQRVPRLKPVTITFNGQAGPNGNGGHSVPKLDLVSRLQALMHTGKLTMPETLPLAKTFRSELLNFRVSYSAVGNATFGARTGAHDDLILAVALAVYGLDSGREWSAEPLRF